MVVNATRVNATRVIEEPAKVCELKAADILLVHKKRNLWAWVVRFATRCYWNHALMVCAIEKPERGYDTILVVDPKTAGGIEMGCAAQYLGSPGKFDVAVKRLEADWFQNDHEADELCFRRRVCDIAVREVDTKGSSKLAKLIRKTIRQITVIYRFVLLKIKTPQTEIHIPQIVRPLDFRAYTCSGFVQWCYYEGVSQILNESGVNKPRLLKEVVFYPRLKKRVTSYKLLTTSPADLANCDKLSWKYVIKDGVIREVSSDEEVRQITGSA